MSLVLGEWRASKVRPIPGNTPHGRPVSRVISCPLWSICDDSCDTTRFPQLQRTYRARGMRFQGMAESFTPMWFKSKPKTKPKPGPTTSRRSAPTQVEERDGRTATFSSFAMSSGRLFLDRVGRHQSPSPLHRHTQLNMHSPKPQVKGDILTLLGRGHSYFALTVSQRQCGSKVIMSPLGKVEMSP
jgi:hypothetical protein